MTKRREVERDIARRADENAKRRAAEAAGERTTQPNTPAQTNPLAEHVAARRQRANARVLRHYPLEPTDRGDSMTRSCSTRGRTQNAKTVRDRGGHVSREKLD